MSSVISVFGSANSNLSEISLCNDSSARNTNYTSYSEYETPLMTPREDDDESDSTEIPESPATDYNKFVIASQSSSMLQDKTSADNKFAVGIKSDSFIPQQSKAINDFMEDIFKVQEFQCEPNLVFSDKDSVIAEFYPVVKSTPKVDVNLISEIDLTYRELETISPRYPSLTAAKHKIIEDLSHMTTDKLFSKYRVPSNDRGIVSKIQSKLFSNTSFQSQRSRRSRRSTSIDSILRIDYELQPLNLMLSKLLAEFRAMELRGQMDLIDTKVSDSLPSWCYKSVKNVAVGSDTAIPLNKDFQDYLKYKDERDAFVNFLKGRDLPTTKLDVEQTENQTQTSRSCGDSYSESWTKKDEYSGKIKSSRSRCCKRHHRRHRRRERLAPSKSPSVSSRPRTKGDSYGREILDEITRIDARCAKMHLLEEARKLEEVPIPKVESLETVDSPEDSSVTVRSTELGANCEEEVRWGASGS